MAKVRRDADEDRVKVNAAASKKESELNVKLASLDGLPEKIMFLESDLESKKKSYTLSLRQKDDELAALRSSHASALALKDKDADALR